MQNRPLADIMRPTDISDVVGQGHILGEGKVLTQIIESGKIGNMIFYGPSGTGKTTLASIIASKTKMAFYKLNATTSSVSDIKDIVEQIDTLHTQNGILLYLDEIQYFNKKQQQTLLEFIENGKITIIASTTENPYFYVYGAILSRCNVFQFKEVVPSEIERALVRAIQKVKAEKNMCFTVEDNVFLHISSSCAGDVRKALNILEALILSAKMVNKEYVLSLKSAVELTGGSVLRYDRDGDSHYNIISALQKSIRGSDENAALHYAARLIKGGDLITLCRRLLVIASEDIGLANPNAIVITKSCVDSALQLGLPEGRIPIAQAVIYLATSPKSNSGIVAIDNALAALEKGNYGEVPPNLKDGHYSGAKKLGNALDYKYPHNYKNHYIAQQYLPEEIKTHIYYTFGDNKNEQAFKAYWDKIK